MSQATRVVLLIGEPGSGKSTFINYLANYFLGGTPTAPKVVIPNSVYPRANVSGFPEAAEADLSNRAVSQTKSCLPYEFRKGETTYRFIDTPGLSDTNLFQEGRAADSMTDDLAVQKILEAAQNAGNLHAIIVIVNGSVARLTVTLKNALERIAGNAPDVLIENMLVVLTNCNVSSMNFMKRVLSFEPAKQVAMNNIAFSSPSSEWDDEALEEQQRQWKKSMKSISDLVEVVDSLPSQQTNVFKEMLECREEIKSQIALVTAQLKKAAKTRERLQQLKHEKAEVKSRMRELAAEVLLYSSEVSAAHHMRDSLRQELEQVLYEWRAASTKIQDVNVRLQETQQQLAQAPSRQILVNPVCSSGDSDSSSDDSDPRILFNPVDDSGSSSHVLPIRHRSLVTSTLEDTIQFLNDELRSAQHKEAQKKQQWEKLERDCTSLDNQLTEAEGSLHRSQDALKKQQSEQNIQSQYSNCGEKLQMAYVKIESCQSEILQICKRLKRICSRFNFAKEVEGSIAAVQMAKEAMIETQGREECEEVIDVLRKLPKNV